jgi:uncharacterized membrane protein HdeD (DUF308 family)
MKLMEKNVGKTDRIVRLVLGIAVMAVGYIVLSEPISYLAMLAGLILLVTGVLGTCGLYSVFGINTCKIETD